MAENYKFNLDPKSPRKEDIEQHQDFDALLDTYRSTDVPQPTRRLMVKWRYWAAAAAAAVALVLVYFFALTPKAPASIDEEAFYAQRPHVETPIMPIQPAYQVHKVAAKQGGVIEYPSGSRLVIPAIAFQDEYGKQITGDVSIHYHEMHDAVDFFLRGIPMYYDSAGVRYNLESAGMVEIYAEQDGRRVRLAPNKALDLELVSSMRTPEIEVPPSFNIYRLDTVQRHWEYQALDDIHFLSNSDHQSDDPGVMVRNRWLSSREQAKSQAEQAKAKLIRDFRPPQPPVAPKLPQLGVPTFELDFINDVSAAEREYQGTIWQFSPNEKVYGKEIFERNWNDANLQQTNTRDYQLTLTDAEGADIHVLVQPVLIGTDFSRAKQQYAHARESYEIALAAYEQERANRLDAIKENLDKALNQADTEYQSSLVELGISPEENHLQERAVMSRFRITEFGIWNCDRPIPPLERSVQASFTLSSGQTLHGLPAFHVDRSRNTLYRFVAQENTSLEFNALSENLLWVVLPDGRIATANPDDFKAVKSGTDKHTFVLELHGEQAPETEEDVRKLLSI